MTPIDRQRAIIEQLQAIVSGSCPPDATSASCRFDYLECEDGSCSVTQSFEYVQQGKPVSAYLDRALRAAVLGLVQELHARMKEHTGGDWSALVLGLNADGSVTARFAYPDQGQAG